MYRNNRMHWLEQQYKHTYNFESTSQIIELILRLKEKLGLFCKKILQFLHYLSIVIYHIVIFLWECIDTFKFCIIPSLVNQLRLVQGDWEVYTIFYASV